VGNGRLFDYWWRGCNEKKPLVVNEKKAANNNDGFKGYCDAALIHSRTHEERGHRVKRKVGGMLGCDDGFLRATPKVLIFVLIRIMKMTSKFPMTAKRGVAVGGDRAT